jgi:cyclase
MARVRVIPVLLLKNNGLYKTINFKEPRYIGDPMNAVKLFNDKEVDELIFLDITATKEKKGPNYEVISEVASECFMPFSYGGGIDSIEQMSTLFSIGVEKVVLNTVLHSNLNLIKDAADRYGSQSIVASIDVKKSLFGKYEVLTHSGTISTKKDPIQFAIEMQNAGVGEIIINSIDRDGVMKGYDIDLIKNITSKVDLPLIACGGAGTIDDLSKAVKEGHASAVGAGSMFIYHGKHNAVLINYPNQQDLKKIYE